MNPLYSLLASAIFRNFQPQPVNAQPLVPTQNQQRPVPQDLNSLEAIISKGLSRYPGGTPIATMSAQLARAGQKIQQAGGDPLLPTIISLKESGGGKKQAGINNPYGTIGLQNGRRQFVNYPSPEVALFGGDNNGVKSSGFLGNIMKNYQPYLKSGRLEDFFSTYTPTSDPRNPSILAQIDLYNQLRGYFK